MDSGLRRNDTGGGRNDTRPTPCATLNNAAIQEGFRLARLCKNSMGIQRIKPTPPFPCPHLAIPAQAGIQHNKRALRAPSGRSEGAADSHKLAPPPAAAIARMCAFRALFALDSRLRGNGGYLPCQWEVFRADLDFRSFYTACCAGMTRGGGRNDKANTMRHAR